MSALDKLLQHNATGMVSVRALREALEADAVEPSREDWERAWNMEHAIALEFKARCEALTKALREWVPRDEMPVELERLLSGVQEPRNEGCFAIACTLPRWHDGPHSVPGSVSTGEQP